MLLSFVLKYIHIEEKITAIPTQHNNNDRLTAFDPGQPG